MNVPAGQMTFEKGANESAPAIMVLAVERVGSPAYI